MRITVMLIELKFWLGPSLVERPGGRDHLTASLLGRHKAIGERRRDGTDQ